jgi:hypothetical protein
MLREEYEQKKQAGPLSADEQTRCENIFAEYEDICGELPPVLNGSR